MCLVKNWEVINILNCLHFDWKGKNTILHDMVKKNWMKLQSKNPSSLSQVYLLNCVCEYLSTDIDNSGVWSPHVAWMCHLCFPLALMGVTYAKEENNRLHLWLITTVLSTLGQASLQSSRFYQLLNKLDSIHRTGGDTLHLHNMELKTGLQKGN